MSADLILGRTRRDWSIGRVAAEPSPESPRDRLPPAPAMAETARAEFARTASRAIRSRRLGRLPEADWRGFAELHRRWVALSDARQGRWRESDTLPLWNMREQCRAFSRKLDALEQLASPAAAPAADIRALVPAGATAVAGSWYVALGAALALAGARIFSRR